MTPTTLAGAAVLLVGLLAAAPAGAHERSTSHSAWRLEPDGARVEFRAAARDVELVRERLEGGAEGDVAFRRYLLERLRLGSAGGPCEADVGTFRPRSATTGSLAWEWRVACSGVAGPLTVSAHVFAEGAPHHLHFAHVTVGDQRVEGVLTEGHRAMVVDRASPAPKLDLAGYFGLGVRHVTSGLDHLAFLTVLLTGGVALGTLVRVVTGFTVGHTLTLAAAALGWLRPDVRLVEAAIGVSIVVVAVENVWLSGRRSGVALPAGALAVLAVAAVVEGRSSPHGGLALLGLGVAVGCCWGLVRKAERPGAWRGALAAGFGLIHGLGFAGALTAHPVATGRLIPTLASFNLGVEVGQLAFVAAAWLLLTGVSARHPRFGRGVTATLNAAACGAGVFWVITRLVSPAS